MKKLLTAIVLSATAIVSTHALAERENATCTVSMEGTEFFNGPCVFKASKEGFTIKTDGTFAGEINKLVFKYTKPGVAKVTGIDHEGYGGDWGIHVRNGACWVRGESKICARGK